MKRSTLISFLFLAGVFVLMRWQGAALITPLSPRGIIDLEFAKTPGRLQQLRLFWNDEALARQIYIDFLFIAAYAWFFAGACKLANNTGTRIFTGLAFSAAAFDVLENFLMMLIWNGRFSPKMLAVVYYVAFLKFVLAAAVVVYLGLSLFGLFKRKEIH